MINADAFRGVIRGRVAAPGDPGYDELRKPWLTLVEQHPALVVEVASTEEVAATVRLACEHGLEIGVMTTGHGIALPCDGGVLLNLKRLNNVYVDAERKVARIGPGVTSGDVLAATEPHGLVFPSGQAGNVGATGFMLGGGIGWLLRKLGPASSHVVSATVVLADGSIVRASIEEHADLFWALRGGGGNFGVVVELEIRLAAMPVVHGGLMYFPVSRTSEVLRAWRDWSAELDENTSSVFRLMALPVGWMPHFLDGLRLCAIGICHADPATVAAVLEPLAALGRPLYQNLKDRPLSGMTALDPASHLSRSAGYGQSSYLRSLSDEVIETLLAAADRHLPPLQQLEIQQLGGALAASGGDAAFEPFDAPYLLHQVTEVNPLDPIGVVSSAVTELTDELKAALTDQAYFNYLRWNEQARIPFAFTSDKFDRLRAIKRLYDPENRFHLNLNILPALA